MSSKGFMGRLSGVQIHLKLAERLNQLVSSTKLASDLRQIAMLRDRWHFEYVGNCELGHAVFCVLVQQLVDDGSGLWSVLVEEILLVPPELIRPLLPGQKRGIISQVAEKLHFLKNP